MAKAKVGDQPAGEAPTEKVTKTEAVKRAVAAGYETAAVGVPWIKRELGIEMSSAQFSTNKSNIKNKGGSPKGKPGRKPGSTNAPMATTAAAASNGRAVARGNTGDSVAIEDLEAVKALVAKVGPEQAKRLVGLFE